MLINVKHNIEVAHRLSQTPGKCENIHGHSMWVTLSLIGDTNAQGLLEGLEFGEVKLKFREHLDKYYDHHLLLCIDDPLLAYSPGSYREGAHKLYPGLVSSSLDPTTEHIAKSIGDWAYETWGLAIQLEVQETPTNGAIYTRNKDVPSMHDFYSNIRSK